MELQTLKPKIFFNRGEISVETFLIKKWNFETSMNSGEYNFPVLIFKDDKSYKYDRSIIECQFTKYIYEEIGAYQTQPVIIL